MHIVRTPESTIHPRRATAQEVADAELRGLWVVDVRRQPRPQDRSGWLVEWEDDIVFLTDDARLPAEEASEVVWSHASLPFDAA
jgi:hypothetical protein